MQKYWRPTIILSEVDGVAKGSARSIPGYDIFRALSHCAPLLQKFGGHPAAAGMTLDGARVDDLREALNNHADEVLAPEDLIPRVFVDAVVQPGEITRELVTQLAAMEPFGQMNPEPVLVMMGVRLSQPPRVVKEKHLRLSIDCGNGQTMTGMGWNRTPESLGWGPGVDRVDLAFHPVLNNFSGAETVEFRIQAVRPATGNNHG
jgi:single-stranded-DNA-specific exonuclease